MPRKQRHTSGLLYPAGTEPQYYTHGAGPRISISAPVLQSLTGTSGGISVVLTYSTSLTGGSIPTADFTVTVNSSSRSVTAAVASSTTVTLTLASSIVSTDTVLVTYVGTDITNGAPAAAFNQQQVTISGGGGAFTTNWYATYETGSLGVGTGPGGTNIMQEGHQNAVLSNGLQDTAGTVIFGYWTIQGTSPVPRRGTKCLKIVLPNSQQQTANANQSGYPEPPYDGNEKTRSEGKTDTYIPTRTTEYFGLTYYFASGWDTGHALQCAQLHWNGTAQTGMITLQAHTDHMTIVLATGAYKPSAGVTYATHSDWDSSTTVSGVWTVAGMQIVPSGSFQTDKWLDVIVGVKWTTDATGWVDGWYRYPADSSSWNKTVNGSGGGVNGLPKQTLLTSSGSLPSTVYDKWGGYRFQGGGHGLATMGTGNPVFSAPTLVDAQNAFDGLYS